MVLKSAKFQWRQIGYFIDDFTLFSLSHMTYLTFTGKNQNNQPPTFLQKIEIQCNIKLPIVRIVSLRPEFRVVMSLTIPA